MSMSIRVRFVIIGALFLGASVFLYFTLRFKYIERDYIGNLVSITNDIVRSYQAIDGRITESKRQVTSGDLSDYLKGVHERYKDIALLAITDRNLSIRLSSKNDRFIRSADLFEAILKDFTQERFNISINNPYAIRYYDEKTGAGLTQHKFYIFISKIGRYRLLVVYPYHFGNKILVRTALELALLALLGVIFMTAGYMACVKRPATAVTPVPGEDARGPAVPAADNDAPVASLLDVPDGRPDALGGLVFDFFMNISHASRVENAALYICCSPGELVKSMELKDGLFNKIDSGAGDIIQINNDTGAELRKSSTVILDDGRKVMLPLIYNDVFLGTVNIIRQKPFTGKELQNVRSGIDAILRDVYDFITSNN